MRKICFLGQKTLHSSFLILNKFVPLAPPGFAEDTLVRKNSNENLVFRSLIRTFASDKQKK